MRNNQKFKKTVTTGVKRGIQSANWGRVGEIQYGDASGWLEAAKKVVSKLIMVHGGNTARMEKKAEYHLYEFHSESGSTSSEKVRV